MNQIEERKIAYTIPEAAKLSGLSTAYLYKLSSMGKLPVSKMGSRVVILQDELVKFLRVNIRNNASGNRGINKSSI